MSAARPEYLPLPRAILEAMERWYPLVIKELEYLGAVEEELKAEASRARLETMAHGARVWVAIAVERLCDHFFAGQVTVYYFFDAFGHQDYLAVDKKFWITPEAEDTAIQGIYWLHGRQQPPYRLYVLRSEFDALLAQAADATAPAGDAPATGSAPKKRFTEAMLPKLVIALGQHIDKTREERREIVRNLPEFANIQITERCWRKAERLAPPLHIGRPPRD